MNLFGKAPKEESSTSSAEDKAEAKKIFFEYACNHSYMYRADIDFKKYRISKEQEAEWRNEFIAYWRSRLSTEDLTAARKLWEASATESIPDLLALVDQGDSYAKLRIAEALLFLGNEWGVDRTVRKQTRAIARQTLQSVLENPAQVSESHKIEIERLGGSDPEEYIITFAKLARGERVKPKESPKPAREEAKIIPILYYPLLGIILILLALALTTLYMAVLDRLFSALSIEGEIYRTGMAIISLLLAIGTILVLRRRIA